MKQRIPLIYFHGIIPGKYLAIWPVYIIGDDVNNLTFKVAVDELSYLDQIHTDDQDISRRAYITQLIRTRFIVKNKTLF